MLITQLFVIEGIETNIFDLAVRATNDESNTAICRPIVKSHETGRHTVL